MINMPIGNTKMIIYSIDNYKRRTRFAVYNSENKMLISEYILNLRIKEDFTSEFVLDRYPETTNKDSKIFKVTEYIVAEIIKYIKEQEGGTVI